MSNNTTQLGGTASSVSVGKIGVSVAPLILSHKSHHGPLAQYIHLSMG